MSEARCATCCSIIARDAAALMSRPTILPHQINMPRLGAYAPGSQIYPGRACLSPMIHANQFLSKPLMRTGMNSS